MKKILLLVLLFPIIILGLTGCKEKKDNRKSISLIDPVFGYETVFKYDQKENFSNLKTNEGGVSKEITFENEELDVSFQMYYTKLMKSSYDKSKEVRSKQKYYKEYKFNKYEAYSYGDYTSGIYLNILIDIDSTDTAKILFVSIDRLDSNQNIIVADVLNKELKDFFNSIEVFEIDQ